MQATTTPAAPSQNGATLAAPSQTGPLPTTHSHAGAIPVAPCQTTPSQTCDNFDGTGLLNRTSILKIIQIGFSILTTVCTMVDYWHRVASFINFVGISALIVAILYLVIHSVQRLHYLFGELTFLFELIQYCVWSVFYLTAAIMAMVNAYDALIGTAIFATGGTVAFSIDAFYQIQDWRYRRTENSLTQQAQPVDTTQPGTGNQQQQPTINFGLNLLPRPRPRYNLLFF